jgi:hypothetical protein
MRVEQSPKCTTPQETKVDQSVEISRKSHDMNLEIPYDVNLEINSSGAQLTDQFPCGYEVYEEQKLNSILSKRKKLLRYM